MQSTRGSPGPIWYCQVPRNHDNLCLPTDSELKPSDLLEITFDDGPTGLKAILQDEVIRLATSGTTQMPGTTQLEPIPVPG